jgi:triacylglycerol lipase
MKIRRHMSRANPQREPTPRPMPRNVRIARMTLSAVMIMLLFAPVDATQDARPPGAGLQADARDVERAATPVLLVPGWLDVGADLEPLRERLVEAGWAEDRVATLRFEDPVGSNLTHAVEISRAVEELRRSTGAERVDVIAHSMGGLALRHYLLFLDGGAFARRVVFLGTPHRGTLAAHLAWGDGGEEMVPGSDFLKELNSRGTVPEGVRVKTIRTRIDLRVLPMSSATLPGATDVEICCPTHAGLLNDPEAFALMYDFLGGM